MNKEAILAASRKENKNQNIYEKDVIIKGNQYACVASAFLATLLLVLQIFTGGGINYGLYAIVFAMPMAGFWYKYAKLRRRHELILAIGYTLIVLLFSATYIQGLFSASAIL